jgi:hypothetical protein
MRPLAGGETDKTRPSWGARDGRSQRILTCRFWRLLAPRACFARICAQAFAGHEGSIALMARCTTGLGAAARMHELESWFERTVKWEFVGILRFFSPHLYLWPVDI